MIKIQDQTNLLPELFLIDNYVKTHYDPDVEICRTFDNIEASDVFTLFVNREPDIHTAHIDFRYLTELRPNYVFLTAAWSDTHSWNLQNVNFCSNIMLTARVNQHVDPVSIDKKNYNGLCLFGGNSPIRNIMFDYIKKLNLLDSCLVNLQPRPGQNGHYISYQSPAVKNYDNPEFADIAYSNGTFFSMKPVDEHVWLSQLIARNLYNQCYIDVVTETAGLYPNLFYISEKLSKTLISGMPFLVFGCCGFLKYFQELGFCTYSQWINENYDTIDNNEERALAIIDVLNDFSSWTDCKKIQFLQESRTVGEHNRQLVLNYKHWLKPIVKVINTRFNLRLD